MRGNIVPHRRIPRIVSILLGPFLVAVAALSFLALNPWSPPLEAQAPMQAKPAPIDGKRAFGYLEKICAIGPRIAGTKENAQQYQMAADHFTKLGLKITPQHFRVAHPLTGQPVDMTNLIASWKPERQERILLCAHYDTRPHADEEMDRDRHRQPFLGANDCASGVALLMEIAHHLDKLDTPFGIDLVLLDGEELVYGNNPPSGEYFLGSTYFAQQYARQRQRNRSPMRYHAGILFDMVGAKDMEIKRDPWSLHYAPWLVNEVWTTAQSLKVNSFTRTKGREVRDDHLSLNEIGRIPTIDLIDFEYPHWHKIDDVPANCSAESLEQVGRVVTAWLNATRPRKR